MKQSRTDRVKQQCCRLQPYIWAAFLLLVTTDLVIATSEDFDDEDGFWRDKPTNTFRRPDFRQDRDHIQHHMKDVKYDFNNVGHEELDFHFFKLHDLNSDNRLDGLEILAALRHGAKEHYSRLMARNLHRDELTRRIEKLNDRLAHTVDIILEDDDKNNDGYLTYAEYVSAYRAVSELEKARQNAES